MLFWESLLHTYYNKQPEEDLVTASNFVYGIRPFFLKIAVIQKYLFDLEISKLNACEDISANYTYAYIFFFKSNALLQYRSI
jgi:hypothetical protein